MIFPRHTPRVGAAGKLVMLLAIMGGTLLAPAASGATGPSRVTVSDTRPRQGEVVTLRISDPRVCAAQLLREEGALPFWESDSLMAWLGVDIEADTGTRILPLLVRDCGGSRYRFETVRLRIRSGSFPVQRLTIPDTGKVVLDEESRRKVAREKPRIRRILRTTTPSRLWREPFVPPLEPPRESRGFGTRRIINGRPRNPHGGADYSVPIGTAVFAVNRARVALVGNFFFEGRSVFLDHGRGLYSLYFHLSEPLVETGETVQRNQLIGLVGASGRVTGPHLHLEMRLRGARVDPDWFFGRESFVP